MMERSRESPRPRFFTQETIGVSLSTWSPAEGSGVGSGRWQDSRKLYLEAQGRG